MEPDGITCGDEEERSACIVGSKVQESLVGRCLGYSFVVD